MAYGIIYTFVTHYIIVLCNGIIYTFTTTLLYSVMEPSLHLHLHYCMLDKTKQLIKPQITNLDIDLFDISIHYVMSSRMSDDFG